MTTFGIDFGTTNSVLASMSGETISTVSLDEPPQEWAQLGFDKLLPSVIADGDSGIEFGWRARQNPKRLEAVKRLFVTDDPVHFGTHTMQLEEAAAIFFKQIKQRASLAGLTLDQAVVTVPANSRGKARSRTKAAAGLAGIEVLALLNEPTAAAMAYSRLIEDDQLVMVFDFGGGTLDVTILRSVGGVFIEEASKGIGRLGGRDLDAAFKQVVAAKVPASSVLDLGDLELAKIRLSSQETTTMSLLGGSPVTLSRADFESSIKDLVAQCEQPIRQCLSDMDYPKIDHLVLVGGSSKIPYVRQFVSDIVGRQPLEGVDPMTAIAEGAALAAAILKDEVTDFDFFLATEHALGTIVIDDMTDSEQFSVLIPRNTKLPAAQSDDYVPALDDQKSVNIRVIEGDPAQPISHDDNVILKEWEVEIEPRPRAEAGFSIRYQYDVDGILHVRAVRLNDGFVMLDEDLAPSGAPGKKELAEIRRRIDGLQTISDSGTAPLSGLDADSAKVVSTARRSIMPFVDEAEQARFEGLIDALTNASGDDVAPAREALERATREHAYLL